MENLFLFYPMEIDLIPSWSELLASEFKKPYWSELTQKVKQEYKTYSCLPTGSQIFNAFNSCSLDKLKVVIIGQDPYPTKGHANGLCFSLNKNVNPLAKSLKNIYKELSNDIGLEEPKNGDLSHWAEQGVFLLNTVLTVREGDANSHQKIGWQTFTDAVIKLISDNKSNVVFLLWGKQAQLKKQLIDTKRNVVLESSHPSPLSAYRGFLGCKHFSKTNEILGKSNQSSIKW